jgi:hypothetical protein
MTFVAYEGVVENGHIQLPEDAVLPDRAKVYVMVEEVIIEVQRPRRVVRLRSPRLKDQAMAALFELEVSKELDDAAL